MGIWIFMFSYSKLFLQCALQWHQIYKAQWQCKEFGWMMLRYKWPSSTIPLPGRPCRSSIRRCPVPRPPSLPPSHRTISYLGRWGGRDDSTTDQETATAARARLLQLHSLWLQLVLSRKNFHNSVNKYCEESIFAAYFQYFRGATEARPGWPPARDEFLKLNRRRSAGVDRGGGLTEL